MRLSTFSSEDDEAQESSPTSEPVVLIWQIHIKLEQKVVLELKYGDTYMQITNLKN